MQGTTGTFAIGGTEFLMQPTEHGWSERNLIGISGEARPTYPAVRQYEMSWNFMTMAEFSQLVGFYTQVQSSGTVVVDLPKYAVTPYQFYSYSGCTLKKTQLT